MGQIVLASAAAVSGTGPVSGSAQSTSSIDTPNSYEINLIATDVQATSCRVALQDSPDGSTWTDLYVWSLTQLQEQNVELGAYNVPGLQISSNAQARLYVLALNGTQSVKLTGVISWAS